ncbi:MAG: hypothetical protein C5B54_07860 [Acidobacteria bacterium]|nr:MAG: hypothetical protein C5B54_07860 [Acidobacteriota bacterium]
MKNKLIAVLFFVFTSFCFAEQSALDSLVNAEKSFASMAVEKGRKEAFVAYLSDDSIIFRPGPINGKKFYSDQPARPGILSWKPAIADVSSSGDLGYTTGPWEFRKENMSDTPVAYGYYFSIWKKQSDGSWKVMLDHGIDTTGPSHETANVIPGPGSKTKNTKKQSTDGTAVILNQEQEFSKASQNDGMKTAFQKYALSDVLIVRDGKEPFHGAESLEGNCGFQPVKADVSADFAYDYGSWNCNAQNGNYVRVWKKQPDGQWRLAVDVSTPIQQQ